MLIQALGSSALPGVTVCAADMRPGWWDVVLAALALSTIAVWRPPKPLVVGSTVAATHRSLLACNNEDRIAGRRDHASSGWSHGASVVVD